MQSCLLLTLLSLSGCMIPLPIPGRVDTSPAAFGRVVDELSKEPVEAVTVTFKDHEGHTRSRITTPANGEFALGPERHTYYIQVRTPCPCYLIPRPEPYAWFLEMSRTNYVTKEINLREIYFKDIYAHRTNTADHVFRLGDVGLDRVKGLQKTNTANQAAQPTPRKRVEVGR